MILHDGVLGSCREILSDCDEITWMVTRINNGRFCD